jgi:hypothetical protein
MAEIGRTSGRICKARLFVKGGKTDENAIQKETEAVGSGKHELDHELMDQ